MLRLGFFFANPQHFVDQAIKLSLTFLLDLKIVSQVANCINSVFTVLGTSDLQLWVLNLFIVPKYFRPSIAMTIQWQFSI